MKRFLLLILIIVSGTGGFAQIPFNALWQKANEHYSQGRYDSAAHYYEQLAKRQPEHAEVYYNLGNTYYRLNQVGPAVLNYERALVIDPGYSEARDNLVLTQSRISNRIVELQEIFFMQWWKTLTRPSLASFWAVAALVFFLLTLAVLFQRRWGRGRTVPLQIAFTTGMLFLCALSLAWVAARHQVERSRAVVMVQDAPLRAEPGSGKNLSLIPEGTVVKKGREESGWVLVRLPDGRKGWMQTAIIEEI